MKLDLELLGRNGLKHVAFDLLTYYNLPTMDEHDKNKAFTTFRSFYFICFIKYDWSNIFTEEQMEYFANVYNFKEAQTIPEPIKDYLSIFEES